MRVSPPARALAVAIALVLGTAGCAAAWFAVGAAAGVGAYSYVTGNLSRSYDRPVPEAEGAAQTACQNLGLKVEKASSDELVGEVVAERADGTDVRIQITRVNDREAEIGVRVGLFGDKEASLRIHEEIAKALGVS